MAVPERTTAVLVIGAPLERTDLPGLYARVCRLLAREGPEVLTCDVHGLDRADAVAVDALARLQLAALRHSCRVLVRGAGAELLALIDVMGLREVLRAEDA